jgi:hypothetical protein
MTKVASCQQETFASNIRDEMVLANRCLSLKQRWHSACHSTLFGTQHINVSVVIRCAEIGCQNAMRVSDRECCENGHVTNQPAIFQSRNMLHIFTGKVTWLSSDDNVIHGMEAFPITWEVQENCGRLWEQTLGHSGSFHAAWWDSDWSYLSSEVML